MYKYQSIYPSINLYVYPSPLYIYPFTNLYICTYRTDCVVVDIEVVVIIVVDVVVNIGHCIQTIQIILFSSHSCILNGLKNYLALPRMGDFLWPRTMALNEAILIYDQVIDNHLAELCLLWHWEQLYKVWAAPIFG